MHEPITNPAELAHVLSEISCDGAPLHERVWRSVTDGLWARLPIIEHTAPSTLDVANEDGWEEFWEAWWQPQGWSDAGVALRDAKGVHWLAWTSEDGDTYVRSYPFEGEEEEKDVAVVQGISLASGLEYPVTVWLDARNNPIAPAYQPAPMPSRGEVTHEAHRHVDQAWEHDRERARQEGHPAGATHEMHWREGFRSGVSEALTALAVLTAQPSRSDAATAALAAALAEYDAEKERGRAAGPMEAAIVILAGQSLANAVSEALEATDA